jgi:nitrogen fixation protein FixH
MSTRFTGRHMAAILVAFFAVVVVVNLAMARFAIGTFGGVVVENSYVASQQFNRWLDEAERERALGWEAQTRRGAGGRVELTLAGPADGTATIHAVARHPLGRTPDRELAFAPAGPHRFVAAEALPAGRWRLRIEVAAEGRTWRTEQDLF